MVVWLVKMGSLFLPFVSMAGYMQENPPASSSQKRKSISQDEISDSAAANLKSQWFWLKAMKIDFPLTLHCPLWVGWGPVHTVFM